jgi:hypothetical protein
MTRVSFADLALYEGFERLGSKTRAKRIRKLAERGLSIPSDDDVISIFVA